MNEDRSIDEVERALESHRKPEASRELAASFYRRVNAEFAADMDLECIIRESRQSDFTSTVTAAAVSKNFGAFQDAAVRDPVVITENGRPRTVLISYEDYMRPTRRDRRVELTSWLSDNDLAAIEASEMGDAVDHLNTD